MIRVYDRIDEREPLTSSGTEPAAQAQEKKAEDKPKKTRKKSAPKQTQEES